MNRSEQRNLAILVAVIGGLLAGVAVLANYTGFLGADAQEQPKVACVSKSGACGQAAEAGTFADVCASVESAPAGGGCCGKPADGCEEKPAGCCRNVPVRQEEPAGCCSAKVEGEAE